jgi:hypothetical protein
MPTHARTPKLLDTGETFKEWNAKLYRMRGDWGQHVSREIVPCQSWLGEVCRHIARSKVSGRKKRLKTDKADAAHRRKLVTQV